MNKQKIYIMAAAPGSGKSWVARQVSDKFLYVPHDTYGLKNNEAFVKAIIQFADASDKPILTDTPFSLSQIMGPLKEKGYDVRPVFIIESEEVTRKRYEEREVQKARDERRDWKPIPKGHLTRIGTFKQRAIDLGAPMGTSEEILQYLKGV